MLRGHRTAVFFNYMQEGPRVPAPAPSLSECLHFVTSAVPSGSAAYHLVNCSFILNFEEEFFLLVLLASSPKSCRPLEHSRCHHPFLPAIIYICLFQSGFIWIFFF